VWWGGNHNEQWLLRQAFYNSLEMASNLKAKSVSIPAISSGIYDFPVEHCAKIFYGSLVEYLDAHAKTNTL